MLDYHPSRCLALYNSKCDKEVDMTVYEQDVVCITTPEIWNVRDFEHRPEGIAVLDEEGTICYLNAAWKLLIGVRGAEALRVGNNYLEILNAIFDPEESQANLYALTQSLQKVLHGQCDRIELEYPHHCNGTWRWFLVRMSRYSLAHGDGVLVEQLESGSILQERAVGAVAV
jgi:PAS domain S-box-containing protein